MLCTYCLPWPLGIPYKNPFFTNQFLRQFETLSSTNRVVGLWCLLQPFWTLFSVMCLHIVCRNLFKMGKQGKWQAIIQLELQDPKHMVTFSSKDIIWSEIARSNGCFDRVAKIPSHRVSNFIRGEEMNPDAPCSFIRRKKKESGQNDTASLSYEV